MFVLKVPLNPNQSISPHFWEAFTARPFEI